MSVADRLQPFGVTVFSEMTALAAKHDAINLGQGYPNWPGADFVKAAATRSMNSGSHDQYPPSPGIGELRRAVALRYGPLLDRELDPDREVTITSGCTEGLAASFLGLVNPGDEVVVFQPFYDAYPVNVALAGATPRFVTLEGPDFSLDEEALKAAVSEKTKALVLNTPHNPTGHVFSLRELEVIADLCRQHDVIVIADEVYEEITFGVEHHRIARLPEMWERTITLSSLGKTFSLTGWKLGWAVGPPELTAGLRAAHQFLTFTTATPVQYGGIAALNAHPAFFDELRASYQSKRDLLASGLSTIGFDVHIPDGTYFLMAGFDRFGFDNDRLFARHLVEKARVAVIPPSAFYDTPGAGTDLVRFAFCKDEPTLQEAVDRLDGALR